jgi:hypothetical protein
MRWFVETSEAIASQAEVKEQPRKIAAVIAGGHAFRYAVSNLTQAVSLDIAEGKGLEGSMIGLLWGNNATFGALSPLLLGVLITAFAATENEYQMLFSCALIMNLVATVAAFFLPNTGHPDREIPEKGN